MSYVLTVLGPIAPDELGITLPHEHLISDVSSYFPEPDSALRRELRERKVEMSLLGALRRDPHLVKDNVRLDDVDTIVDELSDFKRAGGSTIVELTSIGLGRDVQGLRASSAATGIHVVAGTSFYEHRMHPYSLRGKKVEEIADIFVCEIHEGIDGTGIRAGIIGEVGVSSPIHPDEEKVLQAAASAHVATGAAINVHHSFGREALASIEILVRAGVRSERVILSHIDGRCSDPDYQMAVAESGAYIEFDGFGIEWYVDNLGEAPPRDTERITALLRLIEAGFLDRILISQDVFTKSQLKRYGGWGYDHILVNVVPMMHRAGLTDGQIHRIMVDNPSRVLALSQ